MDSQPAALLPYAPNIQPGPGDINAALDQQMVRPGQPYFSAAYIMSADLGPWGVPYWMRGIPLQTCTNMYITAPGPWQKSIITHAAQLAYSAGQYAVGSAPTGGVYTGVEDSC